MRQLAYNEGVQFPLEGMKSSDKDIGVMEHGNISKPETFSERIASNVVPIIKKSINDCGFSYLSEGFVSGYHEITHIDNPKAIEQLPAQKFMEDFYVAKTLTPQEMHRRLKGRSDYEAIKSFIPDKDLEVKLVLSINESPFYVLLNPIDTRAGASLDHFKRARTLDMMADKIVRSMTPKYKPTDFIDIYNLIKGYHYEANDTLKDLSPESPNNRLGALRVMIITYMASSNVIWDRPDLLSAFENTPENKRKF